MSGRGWIRLGRWTPYDVVRVVLGLLLLVAAGLKGYQLATEPLVAAGVLNSGWFLIGTVEFEFFLGLWLCEVHPSGRDDRRFTLMVKPLETVPAGAFMSIVD